MVNHFIDNDPNAGDPKKAWLNDSGINENDNNLLWQYYKNCKLRADNNVPYGAMFNKDASEESTGIGEALYGGEKENEWGSGPLSQGGECYIDGQNLIKNSMPPAPSENASEGEVRNFMKSNLDNYTDFGKKLMFMLFLRDERAQCILDGEENCQELWNKKTLTYSDDGYGGQARDWPLASSTNVTQKFGNGSKGIMIAGKAEESVLAVMDGNVDRVTVESDGSYSVVIKSVDGSREDFYSNLEIVSVSVTDSVYSGQVIGKLRGSGISDAPVRADKDGWVVKSTEVSLTVKHDGQAGLANYSNLTNIPEKFKDASQTNMIPVAEGEIIGYAKSSVHLDFKIKINGEYVDPMNLLNPYASSGGPSVKITIGELDKYTTGPSKDYIISVLNAIAQKRVFQSAHSKICFVNPSRPYVAGLTAEECKANGSSSSLYGSRCLQFANHHAGVLAGGTSPNNMTPEKGASSDSYGRLEPDPGLSYPISDGSVNDPTKQRVLDKIFREISNGQVCVLKVGGTNVSNSRPPRHFVTVVGFKNSVTSANQLKESDLLTIDSWDGRLKPLGIPGARYMFHQKGSWWVRCTR
jgi:murein DD-endopeptidase MepM/ murein hydrolase activator NlpD